MGTLLALQMQISLAILMALLLRCFMNRLPRRWSYGLWIIVFLRLLIPIGMESPLGILPGEETLERMWQQAAERETDNLGRSEQIRGTGEATAVGETEPSGELQAQISGDAGATESGTVGWRHRYSGELVGFLPVWFAGVAAALGYNLYVMLQIHKKTRKAEAIEESVYLCPGLETPFTVGVLRPRIYLPSGLRPEESRYILCHERIHIRRRDYLVKGIAFLLTAFCWYNPLIWVAFGMLEQDMEMSCDEAVIRSMGKEIRRAYSQSLLNFAAGGKLRMAMPLTFGANGVRQRVKNILKGKHSGKWGALAGTLILAVAAAAVLIFTADPEREELTASQTDDFRTEGAVGETVPPDSIVSPSLEKLSLDEADEGAQSEADASQLTELLRRNEEEHQQILEEYQRILEEIERLSREQEGAQPEADVSQLIELLRQDEEEYRRILEEIEGLPKEQEGAQPEVEVFQLILRQDTEESQCVHELVIKNLTGR